MTPKLLWKKTVVGTEAFHVQSDLRTKPWGLAYHQHDFAEIFWLYTGTGRHRINGQIQELRAGQLVFIRPDDCHTLELIAPNVMGLVNVAFPLSTLRHIQQRYFPRDKRWFWKKAELPEVCTLEPARLTRLQEWADALGDAPRTIFEIERFLLNVFHLVAAGVERETLPPEAPDWLAAACVKIRERAQMQEGVAAWVRLAGRSPEHVARVTRQWLGLSPTEYVNQLRLDFLERQLRLTSHPILDLVLEAGFSNLGHAYRLFKNRYGLPPRQYRQKHRKVVV